MRIDYIFFCVIASFGEIPKNFVFQLMKIAWISNSVSHAHSWSFLKPHMLLIIQEILFPIMQYSEEDEDLYQNDTIEYIRRKFGKPMEQAFRKRLSPFKVIGVIDKFAIRF